MFFWAQNDLTFQVVLFEPLRNWQGYIVVSSKCLVAPWCYFPGWFQSHPRGNFKRWTASRSDPYPRWKINEPTLVISVAGVSMWLITTGDNGINMDNLPTSTANERCQVSGCWWFEKIGGSISKFMLTTKKDTTSYNMQFGFLSKHHLKASKVLMCDGFKTRAVFFQLYNDPGDGFLLVLVCFASVNMGEADLR